MEKFTAKMEHNKDTITLLSVTQYNCFQFKSKLIRVALSIILIAYGLYADQSMITPIICLILGCLLIANVNLRPRVRASKIIEQMQGHFPRSDYRFTTTGFTDGKGGQEVSYGKLIRLVEDRSYFYLYVSEESAYMVDKSTVSGGSVENFKDYLCAKTSLKWTRPTSLLNFSLRTLIKRRDDEYQGPRLK